MDEQFIREGNTLKYTGDVTTLPHCKKCETSEGENHDFVTVEHPYKMAPEDDIVTSSSEATETLLAPAENE